MSSEKKNPLDGLDVIMSFTINRKMNEENDMDNYSIPIEIIRIIQIKKSHFYEEGITLSLLILNYS